eukprot:504859_1
MGASCTTKIQYEHPAEEEPLAKEPPTKKEPPQEPSQEEPPKEEPPKEEPPKEEPPKEEPPKEEPPKEEEPPREEAKEPETKNDEDMVWDDVFTNLFKQLQIYQIRIARKGKIITTIDIKGTDKVQTLKNKLFAKEGIPQVFQKLIFAGKIMQNDDTINCYKIKPESTVQIYKAYY